MGRIWKIISEEPIKNKRIASPLIYRGSHQIITGLVGRNKLERFKLLLIKYVPQKTTLSEF